MALFDLNQNQGMVTGQGQLSNQDIQALNNSVPGVGAQGFMKWQNQSNVNPANASNNGVLPDGTAIPGYMGGQAGGGMLGGGVPAPIPMNNVDPNSPNPNPQHPIDASWVQGYLLRQQNDRANQENARQQDTQSMMDTKFAQSNQDRTKKQIIDIGMQKAAQQGGYEGVIQYLKIADPDRAMSFDSQKKDLDAKILRNDTMKTTLDSQKQNAMFESYGVLGKMGMAILKAAPEDREAMYNQMKPMIKQVVPDAPDDLQAAVPMFMLGAAQAMPASQLFATQASVASLQSKQGVLLDDITKAASTYGTDSEQVKLLQSELQNNMIDEHMKQVKAATLDQQNGATIANNLSNINARTNKDAIQMKTAFDNLSATTDEPSSPNEAMGPNDLNLTMNALKIFNPQMRINPNTLKLVGDASSIPAEALQKYNKVLQGGTLAPEERKALRDMASKTYQARMRAYDASQAEISRAATANGIDPGQVVAPIAKSTPVSYTPAELTQYYNANMAKTKDPQAQAALTAKYQQMMSQAQGAGGQGGGE
jgi:hypothetical protein